MLSSWFRVCSQAAVTRSLTRGPAGLEYTAFPLLPSASAFSSFTGAFCTIKNNNNEIVKNSLKLPQARASLACFDGDMNRMLCLGGTGTAARRTVSASRIARRTFAAGDFHGTTILCVRKQGQVVLIGDGQVTAGHEILKHNVRKVRRIGDSGVIGGFAGTTADALTLFERLEGKLEEYPGQLRRAAVELAKAWRTEKYLRRLDAVMIVADKDCMLQITGNGDVIEPEHGVTATGSGGSYAFAAARALLDVEDLSAMEIAQKSMRIAADICIYTNGNFTIQCLPEENKEGEKVDGDGSDSEEDKADKEDP